MTQEELKSKIKIWLKENSKDYTWLAEQFGVSKNTINNYLARKPIPDNKIHILYNILNVPFTSSEQQIDSFSSEINEVNEDVPIKTRRRRRTRAQMREDLEREKKEAQELGGYIDQEEEDRKYKLMGIEAQLEHTNELIEEREKARNMENFDMSDPENPECICEGIVYRIVVPANIVNIYKKEAKWINKYDNLPNRKVTVAMLMAKAIKETAETISKYEESDFNDTVKAIKLMEERAQLKKDYSILKAKQELN